MRRPSGPTPRRRRRTRKTPRTVTCFSFCPLNNPKNLPMTALDLVHVAGHRLLHFVAAAALVQGLAKRREVLDRDLDHHGPKMPDLIDHHARLADEIGHVLVGGLE